MGLFKCVPIWEMRKPGREKSGSLQAAMQRTNVDSGLILTLNEGETIELPDSTGTIHVLPSWKWSLYEA